ncbi:hypothetical protein DMC61_17600 [Amycolatopsis sp. WAC 04169]|nr:hypothetical protein DMC61_17600 [Amycolatopsis sp. WAC 04169]
MKEMSRVPDSRWFGGFWFSRMMIWPEKFVWISAKNRAERLVVSRMSPLLSGSSFGSGGR